MFFLNVHQTFPENIFLDSLNKVLHLDTLEAFLHGSVFDKTAFCSGEKQGVLVSDEVALGTIE